MRILTNFAMMLIAAAPLALALSGCKKEIGQEIPGIADKISVEITGVMGEYSGENVSEQASKATVESVVRVRWTGDENVYVLDSQRCLGSLKASVDDKDKRYAKLSGQIESSTSDELLLLYCPTLTLPAEAMTSVSFNFSQQSGADLPFVIYSVIGNDAVPRPGGMASIDSKVVQFSFASSIMKVNLTGLPCGDSITRAEINNVVNKFSIRMTPDGTVKVAPEGDIGTITINDDAGFAAVTQDGRATFSFAHPAMEQNSERTIKIHQSFRSSTSAFTSAELKAAKSYNSVYTTTLVQHFFSVSDGQKVLFAPGNLFCTYKDGTYSFDFEKEQYHWRASYPTDSYEESAFCQVDTGIVRKVPENTSGLFQWNIERTSSDFGAFDYQPSINGYSGDKLNFGDALGDGSAWFTLDSLQLYYLLHKRDKFYFLKTSGTVYGVAGLILAPDDWDIYRYGMYLQEKFDDVSGTPEQPLSWEQAELLGLVFLPVSGYIDSRESTPKWRNVRKAKYWTCESRVNDKAFVLSLDCNDSPYNKNPYVYSEKRNFGYSVRLVKALQ